MKNKLLLLLLIGLIFPSCSLGKGIIDIKAADTIKAADKITGIEKVADKAVIGADNSQQNKTKVGGNLTNDTDLMKEYIKSMKESHTELIGVMWKIIWLLIIQLVGLIGAFGGYMFFTIKSLLGADERRDIREEKREEKNVEKTA